MGKTDVISRKSSSKFVLKCKPMWVKKAGEFVLWRVQKCSVTWGDGYFLGVVTLPIVAVTEMKTILAS